MDRFRPLLHEHGVTEQQWRVLRVIHERSELDATDLARMASVLPPSLSRILKTLESRQFITLRRDSDDGRRTLAGLTPDGETFIRKIAPESAQVYARIEERLGRDRIEGLLDELEGLLEALSLD